MISWTVFPLMGFISLIQEAHIPLPAFGAPNTDSGRFSVRKASAISLASSCSSSPAASCISSAIWIFRWVS